MVALVRHIGNQEMEEGTLEKRRRRKNEEEELEKYLSFLFCKIFLVILTESAEEGEGYDGEEIDGDVAIGEE